MKSEEQIDEAFSRLEAPEIPLAMIARKLLQGKGSGEDEQSDEVEQSSEERDDGAAVSIIAALTTLVQQMGERGFTPQLDNLLAANLSFNSKDLIELAARLDQLAAALEAHPKYPANKSGCTQLLIGRRGKGGKL
jgi:hypothetical protein